MNTRLEFSGKKITVMGLGISGFYTSLFLASKNAHVLVNDIKPENELNQEYVRRVKNLGIDIKTGRHDENAILNSDMIIISPGVPINIDILKKARNLDIPIIGEIELAYRMIKKPIIAITGTNGKSTVTSLIGHILNYAGIKVFVGGNIGKPFISYLVEDSDADIIVLEVSSYQLNSIERFSPFISIILNITPDHLDHYASFEDYANSKLNIFKNQKEGSYLILNGEDRRLSDIEPPSGVNVFYYGIKKSKNRIGFIENNSIIIYFNKKKFRFSLKNIRLIGEHSRLNMIPAIISSLIIDVNKNIIQEAIKRFKGLPHRLETVLKKDGILFINDSKATNLDATIKAINSINMPIILIAGGKDKGLEYKDLIYTAKEKVKYAILIGETAPALLKQFKGIIPSEIAQDMYDAVSKAYFRAKKGDAILLSPACSSFDMFKNYSHRGDIFKDAIRSIFNAS